MKLEYRIIAASFLFGILFWIIDAVLDYLIFFEGTFWNILILDPSPHEIYIRLLVVAVFVLYGIVGARLFAMQRRAEMDLRQIFNTSVPLCVIGADFDLLRVNDTFCSYFHARREDVMGRKCYDVLQGPNCRTLDCAMRKILEGDERCEYEVTDRKLGNGDVISYEVKATPYRNLEGETIGVTESFLDIADRKRAEDEFQELKDNLEIKVEEKTKELRARLAELERFQDAVVDREIRMKELRTRIAELEAKGDENI